MRSTGHLVLFAALLPTSALLVSAIKPALKSHGPALTALRHATPTSPTRARKPLLQQAAQLEGGGRGPRSVVLAAAAAGGSTSAKATTLNLAKNIVGSGILALAAGVAAFSGAKTAVLPAVGLLFSLGAASGYSFNLIARVGQEVGTDTYRDTWAKIFGTRFAIIPALTIMFKTIVGGLCYAIILGDSFAAIAALAGAPKALLSSNAWIGVLSAFVLLPLCLLRDLSSLAIGSVIGTAGTIYTALFMWKRLFDGSYAAGGRFHEAIPLAARPSFTPVSAAAPLFNARIFVLVSMLATAFLAHYNAPKYFQELETPADGTSKEASFRKVCVGGFGIAAALMSLVISGGYLTFGSASQVCPHRAIRTVPPAHHHLA
jgi:sodium-coupled neutral amino acid transporter 11